MSRTVHLLKFWEGNQVFMNNVADKNQCVAWLKESGENDLAEKLDSCPKDSFFAILQCGKLYDKQYQCIINKFNSDNNIVNKKDLYKGLTLHRLKILMALMARDRHVQVRPAYSRSLNLSSVPKRFHEQFSNLLVLGFWFLGSVIEDSLSEDPAVNCGNPFNFQDGDLGFWWAGVVMLDWIKYLHQLKLSKSCVQFYKDHSLKRIYKYSQECAMSHLDRIPQQFLLPVDKLHFTTTIASVKSILSISVPDKNRSNAALKNIVSMDKRLKIK